MTYIISDGKVVIAEMGDGSFYENSTAAWYPNRRNPTRKYLPRHTAGALGLQDPVDTADAISE
jgi:hypothetical protein